MTTVAGIDLSLTSTGMALATTSWTGLHQDVPEFTIETRLVTSKGQRADSLPDRNSRLIRMRTSILGWVEQSDLVVIEALFERTRGGSLLDRAGLWWGVVGDLLTTGHRVVAVSPPQVKKFATGEGNADKGRMVLAASRMWPGWEPSTAKSSEDEADAAALAGIGIALLGKEPFPMTDYRRVVLEKLDVAWVAR